MLTDDDKKYLRKGIETLFRTATPKKIAHGYVVDHANIADVIKKLTALLKRDFVAEASAMGINTPDDVIKLSTSDISKLQEFTGYNTQQQIIPDNIAQSVKELQDLYGNASLTGFKNDTLTGILVELNQDRINLANATANSFGAVNTLIGSINSTAVSLDGIYSLLGNVSLSRFQSDNITGILNELDQDRINLAISTTDSLNTFNTLLGNIGNSTTVSLDNINSLLGSISLERFQSKTITGILNELDQDRINLANSTTVSFNIFNTLLGNISNSTTTSLDKINSLLGSISLDRFQSKNITGILVELDQDRINLANSTTISLDAVHTLLGSISLDMFQNGTVTGALVELNQDVNNLYKLLGGNSSTIIPDVNAINEKVNDALNIIGTSYSIVGTPTTVTSCIVKEKTKVLDRVIAQGDNSILGVFKAYFDCSIWASSANDHYLTITGDSSGCGGLIPIGAVFSTCIKAMNISISLDV